MQRRIKSHGETFKPVKLFLDDIEKIVEILRETSDEISLETDEFVIQDVELLMNVGREYINELKIESRNPYISIELGPNRIWLFIFQDTNESRGTLEKIKAILNLRRQRFYRFIHSPVVIGLAAGGSLAVMIVGATAPNWPMLGAGGCFLFITSIWMWWDEFGSKGKYSMIIPKRHVEYESFWKRNKDMLIVGIVSAIIGGLITFLVSHIGD